MKQLHTMLTLVSALVVALSGPVHASHEGRSHEKMSDEKMSGHSHDAMAGHSQHDMADGSHDLMENREGLQVDPDRIGRFINNLADVQVVVVSVKGMVCDFCARGIEKTFKRDKSVRKIDINLDQGQVMIAYNDTKTIDFEDIKNKILVNGQTAIDFKILDY